MPLRDKRLTPGGTAIGGTIGGAVFGYLGAAVGGTLGAAGGGLAGTIAGPGGTVVGVATGGSAGATYGSVAGTIFGFGVGAYIGNVISDMIMEARSNKKCDVKRKNYDEKEPAQQYEEIMDAQRQASKDRPSISDPESEWEESPSRPKQNKIWDTFKSRQKPFH